MLIYISNSVRYTERHASRYLNEQTDDKKKYTSVSSVLEQSTEFSSILPPIDELRLELWIYQKWLEFDH